MNKDQVKGRMRAASGNAKKVVGKAIGDTDMQAEGTVEKAIGTLQAGYGDLKHGIKKAVDNA